MSPIFRKKFDEDYINSPRIIQRKFDKQLKFLLGNLNYPSLRAPKYNETDDVWQARIDRQYRFYFRIKDNTYILLAIKRHRD